MKKTKLSLLIVLGMIVGILSTAYVGTVSAHSIPGCSTYSCTPFTKMADSGFGNGPTSTNNVTLLGTNGTQECVGGYTHLNKNNCHIIYYIVAITNIFSALVGVVIVISLIIGGIQYTSAGSDPQSVAAARKRIQNAILALVLFIFMYSFLQWLVPGGLF